MRVVPRRTVVGDIDRRFDNLSGSHHRSHVSDDDSDDDFRSGCRNVGQCHQQQSFLGLLSHRRSNHTNEYYSNSFVLACETSLGRRSINRSIRESVPHNACLTKGKGSEYGIAAMSLFLLTSAAVILLGPAVRNQTANISAQMRN